MQYRTIVSAEVLARHIVEPDWVVVDCRFSLADPAAGEQAYNQGHIPGAYYAHLEKHLSSPVSESKGRHPLPNVDALCRQLGEWGVSHNTQVVAYDDAGGAMAARLWWLLRWLGHESVAVLDGGWPQWCKGGWGQQTIKPVTVPGLYPGHPDNQMYLTTKQVAEGLERQEIILLDARAAGRFRGEVEPIDSVAGHVPGAINRPFQDNLNDEGLFESAETLRAGFEPLLAERPAETVVHMCGSGVTACHNLLAMEVAGLSGSRLYVGSWSEWIRDPKRAIAR